jgi:inosine-uridine nucleoside N-ribohydrolase
MILITDIGKDTDDAIALVYAIIAGIPISKIIVTSKNPTESSMICHNIISHLQDRFPNAKNIEILLGSSRPLKDGVIHDNFYHGAFAQGYRTFNVLNPADIPMGEEVVAISPMTDLSRLVENGKVRSILFMGQVLAEGIRLSPDMEAYNFKCDPVASSIVFLYQDKIRFAFITKKMAYKVPLKKEDLDGVAETGHPVGEFLREHALTSFEAFKVNAPDLYNRIYKGTDNISFCYDPLCMLVLKYPELFKFKQFGRHALGEDLDAGKLKDLLISTIVQGLKK